MVPNEKSQMPGTDSSAKPRRRWLRWLFIGCVACFSLAALVVLVAFFLTRPPPDRMFHGKLESEWIAGIQYNDDDQVKEWREYGDDGVDVLIRGLERSNRPFDRWHRRLHRPVVRFLYRQQVPEKWVSKLPKPKKDETEDTRLRIIGLLNGLDEVAYAAAPAMIYFLSDESVWVRQIAISYFCGDGSSGTPVHELSDSQKREVLSLLVEAASQSQDEGIRNNAAVALRFYPEEKQKAAPILLTMLQECGNSVRASAGETLFKIAPESGNTKEVATVLIEILNDPDDQVATRAPRLLGQVTGDQERVVAELLKNMKSRDTIVSTGAAMALGNFPDYSESIVPALWEAYQDPEHRVRRWGIEPSLKKLDPEGTAKAGIQ